MKTNFKTILKATFIVVCLFSRFMVNGQACTPAGDQTTYGTNNIWIGYVYSGMSFNTYRGYVNEGTTTSPDFDQSFGGANVTYNTNGCSITTQSFSVRYRLRKTYTNQNIQFTVGGDDGYRLSIDGGATWLINRWSDQSYVTTTATAFMNGTYDIVLEYYENGGDNRITFSSAVICTGPEDPSIYGTNNVWRGYIYQGTNFNTYKGLKTEGTTLNPNFDENFGGDNVSISTIACPINTENFSARFRLTRFMSAGTYVFTVGGDDGYRLSLDGGATWVINMWNTQSYNVASYTVTLNGTYNMVLEYFEVSGQNRVSFTMSANLLPVKLTAFTANAVSSSKVMLNWKAESESNFKNYIVQRSTDGRSFTDVATVAPKAAALENSYQHADYPQAAGNIYYRIAMRDLDGSQTYSSVVTVVVAKITESKLYPTVVTNGTLFLETGSNSGQGKFELFDSNGRQVSSKQVTISYGRQQLAVAVAAKGTYVARISDKNGTVINKMIIVQ